MFEMPPLNGRKALIAEVHLPLTWKDEGMAEVGIESEGRVLVGIDERYFRPTEVDLLLGDSTKAREEFGWEPKSSFPSWSK